MVAVVTYVNECEHEPVEQVRKDMGVGDYFDAITNSLDEAKHARLGEDYYQDVALHPENATDTRILCRKCFLSTGWMKVDFPGAPPSIGLAAVRAKWDEIKHLDAEGYNALLRSRGVKTKLLTLGEDGGRLLSQ